VLEAARALARLHGWVTLSEVAPDRTGVIDPAAIERAWRPETRLVALMLANHETGMIQPVGEVARLAHRRGALLHTDAVQALGRIRVDVRELGCDTLALAAHKFHGPKGVGILWARSGLVFEPLVHGGSQEGGWRAGTVDVPGAVGAAAAAELAVGPLGERRNHLARLERRLLETLESEHLAFEINGSRSETDKVSGVLNLALEGVHRDDLVVGMDLEGIAISAGAACASGVMEPSHVLRAMGLARGRVEGGVRISFGRDNTLEQAEVAARALATVSRRLTLAVTGEESVP
jgi:cysteine desulfurase